MKEVLNLFAPISLDAMSSVKLMNRIDTKYVTSLDMLLRFLQCAKDEYFVQEIEGERLMPYHTIYLDTDNLEMYLAHHNGRKNRYKVRMRQYVQSSVSFVEVKHKDNHGRTRKKRIEIPELKYNDEQEMEFVDQRIPFDAETLKPSVENRFNRITLVNKKMTERLTIDLDLQFHNIRNDNSRSLDDVVIIEVKRDGRVPSPAVTILRDLRIKAMGFSKMAIGMALTSPELKQNMFKQRLHDINKIRMAGC